MKQPSPRQREALVLVADGKFYPDLVKEDDGWHARWRALGADNEWVDEYVRAANVTRLTEDAEDQRHETLHDAWMMALRSRTGLVRRDDAECAAFAEELRAWQGAAAEDVAARASIVFSLGSAGPDGLSIECAAPRGRRALLALGQSAYVFGPLRALRSAGGGTLRVGLSRGEAEDFVRRGARELLDSGYGVAGVDLAAEVSAEVDLSAPPADASGAAHPPLGAKLVVRVAGEAVGAEEIRFLLEQKSTLVFFRDRWIEVDRDVLKEALRALERSGGERPLSRAEALGFAAGIGSFGRMEIERVRAHGWLRGLVNELKAARARGGGEGAPPHLSPDGFAGTLRDYQARGVAWMKFLTDNGFGALLADDMGLGKTVQVIAWMLANRADAKDSGPYLVVAPLTLLANWRHELARFAPALRVYSHQGDSRRLAHGFALAAGEADVVVTSYSLLVRDYRLVREVAWAGIVLDEAQTVKNPDTQAARAVRALGGRRRVALTGTPVENSAADIWSVEEFLNPTFLGDRRTFAERFVKPVAADSSCRAAAKLRRALEPFLLRRLKGDGDIAAEIGDKREIREYCTLSPGDRREYEAALEDYRAGERRQGDVFALITRLKLVCDGEGKKERLEELLESVFANGESALVFTQYAKVGAVIAERLEKRFGRRFPFLHGGLSARQREAAIAEFESGGATAFVLSLKAGGYGLNLVKATHVVHFDRWWNPAVESQATDRAHRIGQTRTVFVHSFITEGTLEEHVDELLARKSRVAGSLVGSGESFLRELGEAELMEVVGLR